MLLNVTKISKLLSRVNVSHALLVILLLAIDQLTKLVFRSVGDVGEGAIRILTVYNPGSLFSLFASARFVNEMLLVVGVVMLTLLWYEYRQQSDVIVKILFLVIMTGITGNVIDRIAYGAVFDWIAVYWWPVFNMADAYISTGVVGLLYVILFTNRLQ